MWGKPGWKACPFKPRLIESEVKNEVVGDEAVSIFGKPDGFAIVEREAVGIDFIGKFDAEGWLFPWFQGKGVTPVDSVQVTAVSPVAVIEMEMIFEDDQVVDKIEIVACITMDATPGIDP